MRAVKYPLITVEDAIVVKITRIPFTSIWNEQKTILFSYQFSESANYFDIYDKVGNNLCNKYVINLK